MKHSCFIFSEGGKDRKFYTSLISLLEEYHARKWKFQYDNASGSAPNIILKQCKNITKETSYNLILCFIDIDKLKSDYPKKWEEEKIKLEQSYSYIKIIWHDENLEDEICRVLLLENKSKHKISIIAKKRIKEFVNSQIYKKIKKIISDKETTLENVR